MQSAYSPSTRQGLRDELCVRHTITVTSDRPNHAIFEDKISVTATSQQASTDLGDSVVILHVESGVYYTLDGVGALVWRTLLIGSATVDELQQRIMEHYDVAPIRCQVDLAALLQDLVQADLVTVE